MSKYIKLEDAIHNIDLEVIGRKEYTGDMKANLFFALDDLPTIEVSEDCISRANLIQDLRKDAERVEIEEFANDTVWRTIGNAPSVIPQSKEGEGEWLFEEYPDGYYHSECSICQHWFIEDAFLKPYKYCPNCGSKMKGADDE